VICQIADVQENEWLGGAKATRVSIFMSVFNVHVNRAPVAGRVAATKHTPGKFAIASLDKASTENERNAIVLETPRGKKLLFVQIAGSVARRILCYAKPGDALAAGQRFGLIRFGSRVDVYFPAGQAKHLVAVGQKVVGGETVLGRFEN
jgi:phosphatidylserine decarboxylase